MKRVFSVLIMLLLSVTPLFAERISEVTLRYGKQENGFRIVLDAEENFVKNAGTVATNSLVKIEFPGPFDLKKQKDFLFEVTRDERMIAISLKDVLEVKSYKLSSPSRIVIDLRTDQKKALEAQKPEQKTGQELKQQTTHKDISSQPQKTAASPVPVTTQPPQQKPAQPPAQPVDKGRKFKTIVVDPGHGGYDSGLIVPDTKEKDVSLICAKELAAALTKKGAIVTLTRKADQAVSLNERTVFANSKNPELFLSLHASASEKLVINIASSDDFTIDTAIKQYSIFSRQARHIEKSREVASALAEIFKKELGYETVVREIPLPLLSAMNAPALLIEYPAIKAYTSDQKLRGKFYSSLMKGIGFHEQ